MFADEELVMELLVNAGQARSDAMEAIRCAGQKDWQGATQLRKVRISRSFLPKL
ncbi:PTS lactose/cellobiose transporter subunit IIA, partial [Escherichia coli]|nr:PTS lactose/cellobiose transporter subunit IIA [Escherichia coli]